MPIDFPNSPAVNQLFSAGDQLWYWDGAVWRISVAQGPVGPTGPTGLIGETGPTGPVFQNVDGGTATTIYGGSSIIDCGNAAGA